MLTADCRLSSFSLAESPSRHPRRSRHPPSHSLSAPVPSSSSRLLTLLLAASLFLLSFFILSLPSLARQTSTAD